MTFLLCTNAETTTSDGCFVDLNTQPIRLLGRPERHAIGVVNLSLRQSTPCGAGKDARPSGLISGVEEGTMPDQELQSGRTNSAASSGSCLPGVMARRNRVDTPRSFFRPVDLTPDASGYLDIIRSLAAMAVMFGHCRAFYFVDYAHVAPSMSTVPVKTIYFLTGFGHQAVMVFFVLSGLFISSSVLRNVERSTWNWRNYVIDRGVRLYLVLVPGLLLGALWDLVGVRFFNDSGIYSAPLVAFGSGAPAEQLNVSSFFGSLFFLQTRFTTVLGSNRPLWSLFNEFWYYVLFPVLISAILSVKRRSLTVVVYVGVAILAALVLGGAADISLFPICRIPWLARGHLHTLCRGTRGNMFVCCSRQPRMARVGSRRGSELRSVDAWDRTVTCSARDDRTSVSQDFRWLFL